MSHTKVSLSALKERFDSDLSDSQLNAFIDDAHLLVDEALAGEGLTTDRLQLIETYLAAGLATHRDPRKTSASGAGSRVDYDQPNYLERAFALDPTGKLRQDFEAKRGLEWSQSGFAEQ